MTWSFKKLYLFIGLYALVFLAFSVYLDKEGLLASFATFDRWTVPAALGLALVNFGLRYIRWERYLATLDIALDRAASVRIFLVGLVLSVTPRRREKF